MSQATLTELINCSNAKYIEEIETLKGKIETMEREIVLLKLGNVVEMQEIQKQKEGQDNINKVLSMNYSDIKLYKKNYKQTKTNHKKKVIQMQV